MADQPWAVTKARVHVPKHFRTRLDPPDWCTAAPLESFPDAQLVPPKDYPIGSSHGGRVIVFDHKPHRVWCLARDDRHPPRSGQCIGLGADCLEGHLDRKVCCERGSSISLEFDNKHSGDTRFITVYWD
jgi:hypothetical protein